MILLAGTILAVLPSREGEAGEQRKAIISPVAVFIVWATFPILLSLLLSLISTPFFWHRYLIGALPPLSLAAGYGLTRYTRGGYRSMIAGAITIAVIVAGYAKYDRPMKEDWRQVAALLQTQISSSDCVLVYAPYMVTPLRYYYRKQIDCLLVPGQVTSFDVNGVEAKRAFLVLSHVPKSEKDALFKAFKTEGWSLEKKFDVTGVDLRLFTRAN